MTTKETWKMTVGHKTMKTTKECQEHIGGSKKYGHGGKWSKDGDKYLALNGRMSKTGIPEKLTTKDGDIPISQTDLTRLIKDGFVKGVAPVEFE